MSSETDHEERGGVGATLPIQQNEQQEYAVGHREGIAGAGRVQHDNVNPQLNVSVNDGHLSTCPESTSESVPSNDEQRLSAPSSGDHPPALRREETSNELEEDDNVWEFTMFKQSLPEESDEDVESLVYQLDPTPPVESDQTTHQVPTLMDWLEHADAERNDGSSIVAVNTGPLQEAMIRCLRDNSVPVHEDNNPKTSPPLLPQAECESIEQCVDRNTGWQVEALSTPQSPTSHRQGTPLSMNVTPRADGDSTLPQPPNVEHHEPVLRTATSPRLQCPQGRRRSSNSNYFANWLHDQNRKRQSAYTRPPVAKKRVCLAENTPTVEEQCDTDEHGDTIHTTATSATAPAATTLPANAPPAFALPTVSTPISPASVATLPMASSSTGLNDADNVVHQTRVSSQLTGVSRKRGTLFPHPEVNHKAGHISKTLNQEMTVQCGWNRLQKRNKARQYRLSRFYRTLVDRYPNLDHALKTCLVHPRLYDGMVIYTQVSNTRTMGDFLQQAIFLDLYGYDNSF